MTPPSPSLPTQLHPPPPHGGQCSVIAPLNLNNSTSPPSFYGQSTFCDSEADGAVQRNLSIDSYFLDIGRLWDGLGQLVGWVECSKSPAFTQVLTGSRLQTPKAVSPPFKVQSLRFKVQGSRFAGRICSVRDHNSRSERPAWGTILVAGLGSQFRVFRGYSAVFGCGSAALRPWRPLREVRLHLFPLFGLSAFRFFHRFSAPLR
jgi:hypothetical protein